MKKMVMLLILLGFINVHSFAQETTGPTHELTLSMNEYEVINHEIIHLEGKPFHQITLEPKSIREDYLLFANFVGDGIAAHRFLYTTWDKEQHFLAGYCIANISNGLFQLLLPKDMKHRVLVSTLLGFGMSVLAGATKEIYDAQNPKTHTADINDFLATAAGGAIGTLTLKFDIDKALYKKY